MPDWGWLPDPAEWRTWPWKDIITSAVAVVGAVLGVYNALVARRTRKLRIQVIPGWNTAQGYRAFSIEVINHSAFPVTIDQIGFLERWSRSTLPVSTPVTSDGGSWPRTLEPGRSVSVHCDPACLPAGVRLGKAFAQTATGVRAKGDSAARKQLARHTHRGTLPAHPFDGFIPSITVRSTRALAEDELTNPRGINRRR